MPEAKKVIANVNVQGSPCHEGSELYSACSIYAWTADERDEPDIREVGRTYPAADAFATLHGEFSLGAEDPAWLQLETASPGFAFDSRCISVCMAANDLNFPDAQGFRTPVRTGDNGVASYHLHESPIVRFVSGPRSRSGCHSLLPVDHETFRVPPLARIVLERIDEPGEWRANGHAIRQRCFSVSLSYG